MRDNLVIFGTVTILLAAGSLIYVYRNPHTDLYNRPLKITFSVMFLLGTSLSPRGIDPIDGLVMGVFGTLAVYLFILVLTFPIYLHLQCNY